MTPEKQILYNLMAETALAYWEKTAAVAKMDIRKPSWKSNPTEIKPIEPFPWYKSMQQDQARQEKEHEKALEEAKEAVGKIRRNLMAEMYAYNHGADFRLLYSDPAKAADMVLMDWLEPKSHALLPDPMSTQYEPETKKA